MLVYLLYVEHRPLSIRYELPKILAIYGSNLYIAITARRVGAIPEPYAHRPSGWREI